MERNGTISPLPLRKYHLSKSSGSMRNGASACTYTFLTRLRSTKSLTYFPPHAADRSVLMSSSDRPNAPAFS